MALPFSFLCSSCGFHRQGRPGSPVAAPRGVPAEQEPFSAGPSSAHLAPTASPAPTATADAPPTVREAGGEVERGRARGVEAGKLWREKGSSSGMEWAWVLILTLPSSMTTCKL